jgi:hypothetical protein
MNTTRTIGERNVAAGMLPAQRDEAGGRAGS